jgi:hypothetical protein
LFALSPPLFFDLGEGVFFVGEILLVMAPSFPFFFVFQGGFQLLLSQFALGSLVHL